MSMLLLITDDLRRGRRLARDLGMFGACQIYNLYEEAGPPKGANLIVSDIEGLHSEALVLLQRTLDQSRGEGVPYLFLVHGKAARAEAQARILGATDTLAANAVARLIAAKLSTMAEGDPVPVAAQRQAVRARLFLTDTFFSGHVITPDIADTGIDLIVEAFQETSVHDWVRAVQRFDDVTHQHCLLVAGLAVAFSSVLGLGPNARHHLAKAALVHDVGKTKIPTAILNKPGRLDEAELAVMRTHPAEGYAMLAGGGFDASLLAVVRSHHEMLDGSGYPDKLRGDQIPDLIRLVTISDIYAALIERRPYKAPMDPVEAYAIMEGMVGRLDADLLRAFQPVTHNQSRLATEAEGRVVA